MNLRHLSALGAAFLLLGAAAAAQSAVPEKKLNCEQRGGSSWGKNSRVCEMKEQTLPVTGRVDVDASPNGGITVIGWSNNQVLMRARIEAWGDTEAEAKATFGQVRLNTAGNKIEATGPKELFGGHRWSVSYEVFVPNKTDMNLESVNGGVNISDVRGTLSIEAVNGGLNLTRLAGKVKAETVNGGVNVVLAGSQWDGEGFEVETVNGGVNMTVPTAYSGKFFASTVNGGLNSDLPNTKTEGKMWGSKKMEASVGSGGASVKVETVNGGVTIKQKGSV